MLRVIWKLDNEGMVNMYTIKNAKEAIKKGIRGYLLKDEQGKYVMNEVNRLPFYLEGKPGIGKTEIVKQIADELEIGYVSFSLVHHTRNSVLGLPVIKTIENEDKYTSYTISEIIAKVMEEKNKGYEEGILLLDEFPCMSETIFPVMLAFLQNKNIGTHTLPEGWVIVLCGNPKEYNSFTRKFDAAIMDRIRTMEVECEADVFLQYGREKGIHHTILGYLELDKSKVYRYIKNSDHMEMVTCRGWENLSHMINAYEELGQEVSREDILQYIKSEEIGGDYHQYYIQCKSGITASDGANILEGINLDNYAKKIKDLDINQKWRIVQSLLGWFEKEGREYLDLFAKIALGELKWVGSKKNKEGIERKLSNQLNNLLLFLGMLEDGNNIREMLVLKINENPGTLQLMRACPCEEYLKIYENKYAHIM